MRGEKCMWEHTDQCASYLHICLKETVCVCVYVCALSRSHIKYSKQTISTPPPRVSHNASGQVPPPPPC